MNIRSPIIVIPFPTEKLYKSVDLFYITGIEEIKKFPHRLSTNMCRNFKFTQLENVKEIKLTMAGNGAYSYLLWSQNITYEKEIILPFWKDLIPFFGVSCFYMVIEFKIILKDKTKKFNCCLVYENILPVMKYDGYITKIPVIDKLYDEKYLYIKDGVAEFIDVKKDEEEWIKYNCDKPNNINVCKEIYKKSYSILTRIKNRKKELLFEDTCEHEEIELYTFTILTKDDKKIYNDTYLKKIVNISPLIGLTNPPTLTINVKNENVEKFKKYINDNYVFEYSTLHDVSRKKKIVDVEATEKLQHFQYMHMQKFLMSIIYEESDKKILALKLDEIKNDKNTTKLFNDAFEFNLKLQKEEGELSVNKKQIWFKMT